MLNQKSIKDNSRIAEIARLRLHEDVVDEILNEYVQKAAEQFDLPIGLVSVVLDDAQKFAASHGLEGWIKESNGTPLEWSFCAHSIGDGKPFLVSDAEIHEEVNDNPLVEYDDVRCYAGVPMITKNGHVIGNFCVIGKEVREFTREEVDVLKEYATKVVDRLEERVSA